MSSDPASVQYPLVLPKHRLKRRLKVIAGHVVGLLRPGRRAELGRGEIGSHLSLADRFIVAGLVGRHTQRGTLAELAPLQDWLWSSGQAVTYPDYWGEHRFAQLWKDGQDVLLEPLRQLAQESPASCRTLCEIGCGSGLVLADVRRRLPMFDTYVGIDLSAGQVEGNRRRDPDPRTCFEAADGAAWALERSAPGFVFLSNGGVLEYFVPRKMQQVIRELPARGLPVSFALAEPIAENFDPAQATESRVLGVERTFSHPYARWFREAGWSIRFQQEARADGIRWFLMVATFAASPPATT